LTECLPGHPCSGRPRGIALADPMTKCAELDAHNSYWRMRAAFWWTVSDIRRWPMKIPLKFRRLFGGFWPGRCIGMRGLIFAHCSSFSQNEIRSYRPALESVDQPCPRPPERCQVAGASRAPGVSVRRLWVSVVRMPGLTAFPNLSCICSASPNTRLGWRTMPRRSPPRWIGACWPAPASRPFAHPDRIPAETLTLGVGQRIQGPIKPILRKSRTDITSRYRVLCLRPISRHLPAEHLWQSSNSTLNSTASALPPHP
jgi:hypothetical protein